MTNQSARINMVKQQLRTGSVLDERILSLFEEFPRHEFVPKEMQRFAYSDLQIPLLHNQRMMTPLEEGIILQSLQLQGNETILEVGTGTGYLTALLSRLCKKVVSVDYFAEFTTKAASQLATHNCQNVELLTGDAARGWLEQAPYDVIVMTGGIEMLSDTLRLQVFPGGKMIVIVGKEPVLHCKLFKVDHDNQWSEELLFETNIPPLIDRLKPKEFVF